MRDFDCILDARGLRCPMPLLKMKQQLGKMDNGQVLQVLTTDPGSLRDFRAWLEQVDHELLEQSEQESEYCFLIRKH